MKNFHTKGFSYLPFPINTFQWSHAEIEFFCLLKWHQHIFEFN
jgi:glutathione peroxidase-family protein